MHRLWSNVSVELRDCWLEELNLSGRESGGQDVERVIARAATG